jgi:hypothetical protein
MRKCTLLKAEEAVKATIDRTETIVVTIRQKFLWSIILKVKSKVVPVHN